MELLVHLERVELAGHGTRGRVVHARVEAPVGQRWQDLACISEQTLNLLRDAHQPPRATDRGSAARRGGDFR